MATERYSFFNSEGTDRRLYDAFDFAKYHADFYDSGVVHRTNDALKVTVKEGMTLAVADGSAFISGYRYELEGGDMTLSVALASGSNRVDRVVLRLDLGARVISLAVKQGTTSPPGLTRTGTVWELSLARVTARSGVSVLAAGDVVDERADNSVCGWARNSADPAFVPSDALPELLWRYTLYPETLTALEKAAVEGNPSMMDIHSGCKALTASNRATTAEAIAGSSLEKWITPNALNGFWNTKKIVTGAYTGSGTIRTISVGFNPSFVFVATKDQQYSTGAAAANYPCMSAAKANITIIAGGFEVDDVFNTSAVEYNPFRYIAFQ